MKSLYIRLFLVLPLLILVNITHAQDLSLYGSFGYNLGFSNANLDYAGSDLKYGYGNGLSLNAGLQYDTPIPVFLYAEAAVNFAFSLQYESFNGVSNKTSFGFNYKSLSLGLGHLFEIPSVDVINGIIVKGGLDYNIPGDAKVTENNSDYGRIAYGTSIGYQAAVKLSLQFSEQLLFDFGLTYRKAYFDYTDYNWNNGTPTNFQLYPTADHIMIGGTLRKVFGAEE